MQCLLCAGYRSRYWGASTGTTDKTRTQYSTFDVNTAKKNQQGKTEQGLGHLVTVFIVCAPRGQSSAHACQWNAHRRRETAKSGATIYPNAQKQGSIRHASGLPSSKGFTKTAAPALSSAFGLHERMTKLECVCPPLKDPERLV